MNVSKVSFASSATTSFQDKIRQPQTYVGASTTAAATGISGEEPKKHSFIKTAGKVVGVAAIAAGLLALGSKFNVFDKIPVKKLSNALNKAGDFVLDKASTAKTFVKNHLPKISKK